MGFFSTKPISQSKNTLGRLLRNTRLKYQVKIHHVAQFTNIRQSYIEAIEKDQWQKLPDLTYAKSFVITYAKFLELDSDKIANRFDIETKNIEPENKLKTAGSRQPFIFTTKTLIQITAVTVFLIIGIFAYLQINLFSQIPKLDISEPADFTQVAVNKIDIKGKTDPDNTIFVNNQPLTTDKNGNFSAPVQLQSGYNIVKITAENKIGKKITATKVVVADLEDNSLSDQITLQVTALNSDIWIRLKDNDQQIIFDGTIPAGSSRSWKNQGTIFFTTTNAAQTSVNINQKEIGILGDEGEIIEDLQISHQPNTTTL